MTIEDFRENLKKEIYPYGIRKIFEIETQKMLEGILEIVQKVCGGSRLQLSVDEYLKTRITIFSTEEYIPENYEILCMRCGEQESDFTILGHPCKFHFLSDLFRLKEWSFKLSKEDSLDTFTSSQKRFQYYQELWIAVYLVSFFKEHHIETEITYDKGNGITFLDLKITPAWFL